MAGFSRSFSVIVAPVLSSALYAFLGILYSAIGISSNQVSIFILPSLILITSAIISITKKPSASRESVMVPASAILIAAIAGLATGAYVFLLRLPRTDAVFQGWDNVTHLNLIRAFINSGDWSSLHPSAYLEDSSIQPLETSGFYPASWHEICALTVLISGAPVAKAVNAVNYTLSAVVYPLGIIGSLRLIFGDRKRILYTGAIVGVSFAQFPWAMNVFGPVYPNLAAFCLIPSAFAMTLVNFGNMFRQHKPAKSALMILLTIIALGFLQPNAVFLLAVLLYFYLGHFICDHRDFYYVAGRKLSSIMCMNIFYIVCLAIWIAIYLSPIAANMLSWRWIAYTNSWQGFVNILTAGYGYGFGQNTPAQLLLALMVIIGALSALRRPKYQWLVQTYVLVCIFCFIDATHDGLLKDALCFIWYSDPARLASMCAIAAVPLAALGLADTIDFLQRKLTTHNGYDGIPANAAAIGTALCFIALNFARFYAIPGWENAGIVDAYSALDYSTQKYYSIDASETVATALTIKERNFAAKAQEVIPAGSVVINDPSDGSVFLYGVQGMRCYYRYANGYGTNETEESKLIRTNLKDIATNEKVRDAVHAIGAKYVLILDGSNKRDSFLNFMGANIDGFQGIDDIRDTTYGFKVILSEGPMRLYEIME